uniref:hypothetical protein n=1 Tax=uncultured Draconibacterium sp. TaxID=1573823 RepID=UPI003217BDA4
MNFKKLKRRLSIVVLSLVVFAGCFVLLAYSRTWGKTEIEFKIHINEELVMQSVFGESPTFAIWLENPETQELQTIFVTNRAGVGDWEGKVAVPSALPKWDLVNAREKEQKSQSDEDLDAVSGATPQPGYFTSRAQVEPGSKWNCWIEMNLSGDYNEHFPEFDKETKQSDAWGTGQPALVYKASIEAVEGNTVVPELVGISLMVNNGEIVKSLDGITTAKDVFDEITISVVKPKPRIL